MIDSPFLDGIPDDTIRVLISIIAERSRQDVIWGQQDHPFGEWLPIFFEELGEACREQMELRYRPDPNPAVRKAQGEDFRKELVEATAVLVAAIECGDRNGWFEEAP